MLGEIWEVPEVLFQRRIHSQISTYANRSAGDLLAWYDPSGRLYSRVLPPLLSVGNEYLQSINSLPLSKRERWRCRLTVISVWYERELRNLGGRYKARLKEAFQKSLQGKR
jgi:hypothetical protein